MATGASHHISPYGDLEPCPIIQFAKETIHDHESIYELMNRSGFLRDFRETAAKTTRGCLSTDDGWIPVLLTAAARTGQLRHVFVEIFTHDDPALEALRNMDPGHGVNTCDGRSYLQVTADGLVDIAHRLNNLKARGILK